MGRHETHRQGVHQAGRHRQPVVEHDGPVLADLDGIYPNLAVDGRGDVAVVFADSPYYYASLSGGTSAWYAFRSATGITWNPPARVSETLPSTTGYISNPQVALDANGLATVIYMGYGVEATRQLGDVSWTPPQTVIQAPNQVSSYQGVDLGLGQNGNAVAAASIFDATVNVDRASVWVAQGTPNGVGMPSNGLPIPPCRWTPTRHAWRYRPTAR